MLVDANLLLYAKVAEYPQHAQARAWLEACLNGSGRVGLPWPSLLAFLRIVTNPRLFETPLGIIPAWAQVQEWLDWPTVWVPAPTDRHAAILGDLVRTTHVTANVIMDAHLAALAIEHSLTLYSSDRDFARFPGVQWVNPLADAAEA